MTATPTPSAQTAPARPPTSVGQVFALVAAFLALAAIGAGIGWAVTDTGEPPPLASNTTTPAPSVSTTPSPTPTPAPANGFPLPDFNAQGTDFQDARSQLIAKKLGVLLVFQPDSAGTSVVVRTDPPAGTRVRNGITVKIYVDEAPPLLAVPDVVGTKCAAAKTKLVSAGFNIHYASGKAGIVTAQNPTSDSTDAHWNDTVALQCVVAPATPSSAPSAPPSGAPTPSDSPA